MEEKKQEELKKILENIKTAITLYNELHPEEKIAITLEEKKKDVSDIFICVYNKKHVGLFKKINWSTPIEENIFLPLKYDAGNIYIGVDSNYIGIKKTHFAHIYQNDWAPIGEKVVFDRKDYVANCKIKNSMSFDDMRLIMYNQGLIEAYELGKANSNEIIEVLKYATSYYQLDQSYQPKRKPKY